MKRAMKFATACLLVAIPAMLAAQSPRIKTVEPMHAKAGDTLTAEGENLGKKSVEEFYLTDGNNDTKLETADQNDTTVKIKVPANAKTGKFRIMLLTGGDTPAFIEQPVVVMVETAEESQQRLAREQAEAEERRKAEEAEQAAQQAAQQAAKPKQ
jgi:hypothetical protein